MALATALAMLLAYFPYKLLDGSSERKAEELERQVERTVEARRELAAENARLRREIEALKNDVTAIEDIARDELGMVRPGEVIIRIDETLRPDTPDGSEPAPEGRIEETP